MPIVARRVFRVSLTMALALAGAYALAFSTAFVIGQVVGTAVYQYLSPNTLWFGIGAVGIMVGIGFASLSRPLRAPPRAGRSRPPPPPASRYPPPRRCPMRALLSLLLLAMAATWSGDVERALAAEAAGEDEESPAGDESEEQEAEASAEAGEAARGCCVDLVAPIDGTASLIVERGGEVRSTPITLLAAAAAFIGSQIDTELAAEAGWSGPAMPAALTATGLAEQEDWTEIGTALEELPSGEASMVRAIDPNGWPQQMWHITDGDRWFRLICGVLAGDTEPREIAETFEFLPAES